MVRFPCLHGIVALPQTVAVPVCGDAALLSRIQGLGFKV